jgi:hypothetical protein
MHMAHRRALRFRDCTGERMVFRYTTSASAAAAASRTYAPPPAAAHVNSPQLLQPNDFSPTDTVWPLKTGGPSTRNHHTHGIDLARPQPQPAVVARTPRLRLAEPLLEGQTVHDLGRAVAFSTSRPESAAHR